VGLEEREWVTVFRWLSGGRSANVRSMVTDYCGCRGPRKSWDVLTVLRVGPSTDRLVIPVCFSHPIQLQASDRFRPLGLFPYLSSLFTLSVLISYPHLVFANWFWTRSGMARDRYFFLFFFFFFYLCPQSPFFLIVIDHRSCSR
jgi:hypothetical protein